jgi:hypothetical protein
MSVQTRSTALQDEIVRLYCTFIRDGQLMNPSSQPTVEILDNDGVTVINTLNAVLENTGIFYVDWYVDANRPVGNYYDRWSFQWDANTGVQEITMIISVHSLDSYINFISTGVSISTSARVNQMLMELSNNFIYEAQHIPVYFEQGQRIQQENQAKRVKNYYYFTVNNSSSFTATSGDVYSNNSCSFTVLQDFPQPNESTDIPNYILSCTGTGNPLNSGDLVSQSGNPNSSDIIQYTDVNKKVANLSTIYSFAYKNWNQDPAPIVRVNNRIRDDGWHLDYDGKIYFDTNLTPEDSINVYYNFSYFSRQELMSFLLLGLQMMNSVPPASTIYTSLDVCPWEWEACILAYAAKTAMQRLIFGWSFQERKIIWGDTETAQQAAQLWQDLYKDYNEIFIEQSKNAKTKKLPGIALYVTPEYTLPGGRSRWFRYLYKANG